MKAMVCVIWLAILGCATVRAVPDAAKVAVVECAKQEARPILAVVADLGVQAALSALGLGKLDWPALEASAAAEGKVVGGCALTRFVAELAKRKPPETSARSLVAVTDPVDEGQAALARLSARFGVTWR